jgi:hypothetical protein
MLGCGIHRSKEQQQLQLLYVWAVLLKWLLAFLVDAVMAALRLHQSVTAI